LRVSLTVVPVDEEGDAGRAGDDVVEVDPGLGGGLTISLMIPGWFGSSPPVTRMTATGEST